FGGIFRHPSPAKDIPHRGAGNAPIVGQGLDGLTGCRTLPDLLAVNDDRGATQSLALLPRPLDTVTDALADDVPLQFGKGGHYGEEELTKRGVRVDGLVQANEANVERLKLFQCEQHFLGRASEPIEADDYDDIEHSLPRVCHQRIQSRSVFSARLTVDVFEHLRGTARFDILAQWQQLRFRCLAALNSGRSVLRAIGLAAGLLGELVTAGAAFVLVRGDSGIKCNAPHGRPY